MKFQLMGQPPYRLQWYFGGGRIFKGGVERESVIFTSSLLKSINTNGQQKVDEVVRKSKERHGAGELCCRNRMLGNVSSTLHFTSEATKPGPVKSAAQGPAPG